MMLFDWIRNGIRRAVVDGFRDAVMEITGVGPHGPELLPLAHEEAHAITNGNSKRKETAKSR